MTKAGRKKMNRLPEEILTELAAIGMTRATDVLYIEDGQVALKSPAQIGKDHAAASASVEKTSSGWKIKFYDKLKALELLGKAVEDTEDKLKQQLSQQMLLSF